MLYRRKHLDEYYPCLKIGKDLVYIAEEKNDLVYMFFSTNIVAYGVGSFLIT